MGYSNVVGDLNVAATTTLSTLVVNGSTQHYGIITSTGSASFANLIANNFTVTGNFTIAATNTSVSNSISIVNQGTKTALYVNQNEFPNMTYNVAEFYDHTQLAMVIDGYGNVAIHQASSPGYALTVVDGALINNLTLGTPLAISSGGTGTSVGAPQNQVFAGPSIGSAGAPFFRALVNADLPSYVSVSNVYANGAALYALNSSNLVGNVANANVALVVSQASQPNITSVGLLTNLAVANSLTTTNVFLTGNLSVQQTANITTLNVGSKFVNFVTAGNIYVANSLTTSNIVATLANITTINVGAEFVVTTLAVGNIYSANALTTTNVVSTLANITTLNVSSGFVTNLTIGNVYSANALTTTNIFGNTLTLSNATSVLNVTGNIYASNALVTTNIFGNTLVLANASATITGNLYVSNALVTTNIFANTLTLANATSVLNVTGNIYASNALVTTNIFGNTLTLANATSVLNVTGNIYASNALVATNIFGNTLTLANATSTINVLGTVTATTFYGVHAGSNIGAFSNLYSANALVTTNIFANTLTLANATATITGNLYASNALVTTNIFGNTLTLANATSTINVLGSVTATTFYGVHAGSNTGAFSNLYSANALVTTNIFGNTLVLSNAFAGNIYASNALSTGNVFLTGSINVQGIANISYANISNIVTQNVTALGTNLVLSSLVVNGNVYASNTVTASNGFYSIGTYGGTYTDGIVMDYVQGAIGNGRLSVGVNDSLTLYTGGPSGTATAYFDPNLRVGLGTVTPGSNLHVVGNVFASNAVTTGSIIASGISNIATANITTVQTPNFINGASGLFLNLSATYTLTSATSWTGNVSGTVTPNLYTLFVAPYSVSTGQWNSFGSSSLINAPTVNGGIRFNQPGPYMITAIISLDSGVKTIALSSNTGNTVDLHSNVTNVWTYCYRSPLGDVNPWPVTIPINVTNTAQYYYLDIEANNQTDNIRQTAYANIITQAYTGSYVIIRPV